MKKLLLKLITPEEIVHEEEVDQVTIPTTEGEITVLPGHVPLVALLGKGDVVATVNGEHIPFVAVDGFVRITGDEVTVLADFAEHVETIANEEAIKAAQDRAKELQHKFENEEDVDFEHFETELERNIMRVKIGEKWKMRGYRK